MNNSIVGEQSTVDYSSMSIAELKTVAKEKGIEGYSTLKKAELIKVLEEGAN